VDFFLVENLHEKNNEWFEYGMARRIICIDKILNGLQLAKIQQRGWTSACTVNKGLAISRPQPGCHLTNSPWPGIMYPIPVPGRFGQNNSGISLFFLQCGCDFIFTLLGFELFES